MNPAPLQPLSRAATVPSLRSARVIARPLARQKRRMPQLHKVEWSQVLPLMRQLQSLAESAAPKGPFDTKPIDAFILGMFWRCVRLHRAATALLETSLPEECTIIARSLFEESLHLQELADTPADRDALILKWAKKSIHEKRGLIKDAQSLGLEVDPQPIFRALDDQQRDLDEYLRRHPVGKLRPFLSVRAAAVRYGRKDCYWTYAWSHEAVHGSDAAWLFARRRVASDTVALFARTDDPALLIGFAAFAARSLAEAVQAVCSIFGWSPPGDLRKLAEQIDQAAEGAVCNRKDR